MAVYRLNDELWFPDPHLGEMSGLVAVGGDLSVKRLLLAYSNGFFPWYSFKGRPEPKWYCPLERYVIFPKEIHISHSMKQLLRQDKFQVTINQNFEGVIRGCSTVDGRNKEYGAWLGPNMIEAYTELNKLGFVSSIEVWQTHLFFLFILPIFTHIGPHHAICVCIQNGSERPLCNVRFNPVVTVDKHNKFTGCIF